MEPVSIGFPRCERFWDVGNDDTGNFKFAGKEVLLYMGMRNPSPVAMVVAASSPNAAVPKPPLSPLTLAFALAFGSTLPLGFGLDSALGLCPDVKPVCCDGAAVDSVA